MVHISVLEVTKSPPAQFTKCWHVSRFNLVSFTNPLAAGSEAGNLSRFNQNLTKLMK